MRERRVVPLRLIPTMKIGESVEDSGEVGFPGLVRGSDSKKIPQSRGLRLRTPRLFSNSRSYDLRWISLNAFSHHVYQSHRAAFNSL